MTSYITEKEIAKINALLIKRDSPGEQIIVKEWGALNATVEMMKQRIFGKDLYPTIFDKASILYIQLITKHIFGNANKRTALTATDIFLKMNHYNLLLTTEEAISKTLYIANYQGDFEQLKVEIAQWLQEKI